MSLDSQQESRPGGDDSSDLRVGAREITDQIFVVSAAMVGVCLTLMGLVGIIISLNQVETLADESLAADAVAFLVACLSAYLSLRTKFKSRAALCARLADVAFVLGMIALVAIGAIVALRLI